MDGTIYFSESTARFPFEQFMAAILEGRPTGRVFRRDPDGTVTTIATGLAFTNGVTITADGSALIIAETVGRRVSRYALTGPVAGTLTPIVEEIPGMPDNISTGADGGSGSLWPARATHSPNGYFPDRRQSARCCGGCPMPCSPAPIPIRGSSP